LKHALDKNEADVAIIAGLKFKVDKTHGQLIKMFRMMGTVGPEPKASPTEQKGLSFITINETWLNF
jgi:hypothetical protein